MCVCVCVYARACVCTNIRLRVHLQTVLTSFVQSNALEAFPPGVGLMSRLVNLEFDGNPKLRLPKNLLRRPVATGEGETFEVLQLARVDRTKKFLRTILEACEEVLWDDLGLEDVPNTIQDIPYARCINLSGNTLHHLDGRFKVCEE